MKVTVTLDIDFRMLKEQKQSLLAILEKDAGDSVLDGIIHVIDSIQDQAAEKLGEVIVFGSSEIRENNKFSLDNIKAPESADDTERNIRLDMFDAYQHFLFYINQSQIESEAPWGQNLTEHFISKLNGLRNRLSPGCNSCEVVAQWVQEMTMHNQEALIDFIFKHHGSKNGRTKWGREL
jgi:hypothetical protein